MAESMRDLDVNADHYDDEDTQRDKYLIFHLAGEDYGIDIVFVTEIVGIQKITAVLDRPPFSKGVINLRDKIIPVMDVRLRFKMEERHYDERTCIIVVDVNGVTVGLVVDEVREIVNIPSDHVEPPPQAGIKQSSLCLKGLGKIDDEVKILLNVEILLCDAESVPTAETPL